MDRPIGVVEIVYDSLPLAEAAERARRAGFTHLDVRMWARGDEINDRLALPVLDRMTRRPEARRSIGALPEGPGQWDRAVRAYRRVGGMVVEPWPGSIIDSIEKIRALCQEVPDMRILLDTGHVAHWGEDPVELLSYATHVQLRQATRTDAQTLEGDVDFVRLFAEMDRLDYRGGLSIEYFDLPERGWPLDDPPGMAEELLARLRSIRP